MRRTNKFKIFNKLTFCLKKFPLRILKFRRPKWFRLQKSLLANLKKKQQSQRFADMFLIKNTNKIWEKSKRYFKKGLLYKNFLHVLYEKTTKFKKLKLQSKTIKTKKDLVKTYHTNSLFRVDILLFNLNFFESIHKTKQYINNKSIFVNGKSIKSNVFLKKGDIITFPKKSVNDFFSLKKVLTKFSLYERILTFAEVDFYTMTIVILKDPAELTREDLYLLSSEYLNVKTFSYNLN